MKGPLGGIINQAQSINLPDELVSNIEGYIREQSIAVLKVSPKTFDEKYFPAAASATMAFVKAITLYRYYNLTSRKLTDIISEQLEQHFYSAMHILSTTGFMDELASDSHNYCSQNTRAKNTLRIIPWQQTYYGFADKFFDTYRITMAIKRMEHYRTYFSNISREEADEIIGKAILKNEQRKFKNRDSILASIPVPGGCISTKAHILKNVDQTAYDHWHKNTIEVSGIYTTYDDYWKPPLPIKSSRHRRERSLDTTGHEFFQYIQSPSAEELYSHETKYNQYRQIIADVLKNEDVLKRSIYIRYVKGESPAEIAKQLRLDKTKVNDLIQNLSKKIRNVYGRKKSNG